MKKLIVMGMLVGLAGCSANPFKPSTVEIKTSEGANTVPVWYLETPTDTKQVIYAASTGLSSDMQFSLDKALHDGKVILGDKLDTSVSSTLTRTVGDKGSEADMTTEKVSKSSFENVDVSKYVIENKLILREGREFRTYVLLKLDVN